MPDYDKLLIDPIIKRVQNHPDQIAMVFIANDGSEKKITIDQLHAASMASAQKLKDINVNAQDVVIIALGHSTDLVFSFWGTLYIDAIPSIFNFPFPRPNPEIFKRQIRTIVENTDAKAVITTPEFIEDLNSVLVDLGCRAVPPAGSQSISAQKNLVILKKETKKKKIAYLQYTSGTTENPKGVLISHQAVKDFIPIFSRALQVNQWDVMVNWMPLFHDGGLFAGLVFPIIAGIPTVLMSSFKWVRNPKTLLWTIHKYKATLCFMPNSGFNHTSKSVRDRDLAGLDLSSIRYLMSTAEPVLYDSQKAFLDRFAPYGLKETALVAAYGMAENTLPVTMTPPGKRAFVDWIDVAKLQQKNTAVPVQAKTPGSLPVVSCGVPVQNVEVKVVDDEYQPVPERLVGEIIIRGSLLFEKYLGHDDLTALAFHKGWFLTGDLGYLSGNELFICGRKKDLIIVGAKNIYPEDIEALINRIEEIYPDRAVAFGILDKRLGSEKIVLICDLKRPLENEKKQDVERKIRQLVFEELNIAISRIHLMKKGWIVKTHNGKISRFANKQKYETSMGEIR